MKRLLSKEHDDICKVILYTLKHGTITTKEYNTLTANNQLLLEMYHKYGLLNRIRPGLYELNLEQVQKVCYVVPDEVYEKLKDPKWVKEQRYKQGLRKSPPKMMNKDKVRARHQAQVAKRQEARRQLGITSSDDELDTGNILFPKLDRRKTYE